MQTVTVKMNTLAHKCDIDGNFSNNIRPHHFVVEKDCEVIKTGFSNNRSYQWYVVRVFASYVFVTDRDVR